MALHRHLLTCGCCLQQRRALFFFFLMNILRGGPFLRLHNNINNNIICDISSPQYMPSVSISLSDTAYAEFASIHKTRRSAIVTVALLEWASRRNSEHEGFVSIVIHKDDLDKWYKFQEGGEE